MSKPENESREVIKWTLHDVRTWIQEKLGLPMEAELFFQHKIDGPTLIELTEEDIKSVIQFDDKEVNTARRLALRKLLGHIHVARLSYTEKDLNRRPSRAQTAGAGPPPRTSRGRQTMQNSRTSGDILTPRVQKSYNSGGEYTSRSVMSDHNMSRSRVNLGTRYTEVDSCFGIPRSSDSMIGSFNRASLGIKDCRPTPGPSTYFGEYGQQPKKVAAPATFPNASRNPDFLFSKGQVSPGVCKYNTPHFDPSKNRGGSMPRASRWGLVSSIEVTPGPSSYAPQYMSLSTFR